MTVKEQQEWKIPPCISNWKNAKVTHIQSIPCYARCHYFLTVPGTLKYLFFCARLFLFPQGYTIPLDKRLAADGRGLQTVHINENFAKLAEALYIADRKVADPHLSLLNDTPSSLHIYLQ